jgi:hypothetical protein
MKSTLIDLFTSKKFLAAAAAIIIYVGGRFGFDVDPAALDRIFAALLVYVGAQGVADVGKGAAQVRADANAAFIAGARPTVPPLTSILPLVALLAIGAGVMSTSCGVPAAAGHAVIDCTKADAAQLEAAAVRLLSAPGWAALESEAIAAGETIGGCALLAVINRYRPSQSFAPAPAPAPAPHDVVERVRAHFGGVTWRTASGDL